MITKPTLFILGAGASKPYGYPIGKELKDTIIQMLTPQSIGAIPAPPGDVYSSLIDSGYEFHFIDRFRDKLNTSNVYSIDSFLTSSHRTKKEIQFGKHCISLGLHLYSKSTLVDPNDDWFKIIWNKMIDGVPIAKNIISNNKIGFLTFNYDLSLESKFCQALGGFYDLSSDGISEIMSELPILHLYGQSGELPWKTHRVFREGTPPLAKAILITKELSEGIKAIFEQEESANFERAKQLIDEYEEVHFLGFGYHYTNLERLGIHNCNKILKGSCFRMIKAEIEELRNLSNNKIQLNPDFIELTNSEYLRHSQVWNKSSFQNADSYIL